MPSDLRKAATPSERDTLDEAYNDTAVQILDVAQALVQSRGYNGFSYRDIAERVGIQAATIHYYFTSKGDLAAALVARYRKRLGQRRDSLARAAESPRHRLELYSSLFRALLIDNDQLCLGAMLTAEAASLSSEVVRETTRFFEDNVSWLADVIEDGRRSGDFVFAGSPFMQARILFAALEGAMLMARAAKDVGMFSSIAQAMISQLQGISDA
ncbi:MAG: TetR/AcrR family transcriptional regulator [Candidatus Binataceae bacterium]